jgi:hypothetical protein
MNEMQILTQSRSYWTLKDIKNRFPLYFSNEIDQVSSQCSFSES